MQSVALRATREDVCHNEGNTAPSGNGILPSSWSQLMQCSKLCRSDLSVKAAKYQCVLENAACLGTQVPTLFAQLLHLMSYL